ncbi:MAG: hypothetical protein HFH61_07755 [Lachnospiraceae bacterium]|nr:hypothetical protein [Lachnospiraceae bacterium]
MKRINREALFSDESEQYRIPLEVNPGDITRVIFRTAKDNVDRVFLISGGSRILMEKFTSNDVFDYYKFVMSIE